MRIGFLGVGNMGQPMAEKLLEAGHELWVCDVREDAMQPLLERQARRANSPKHLADACDTVVVSLGAEGAVAVQGDRAWRAEAPRVDVVNPVGSGDCLLGGIAVGLVRGLTAEAVLALGVACGAANAQSRETGSASRADIDRLLPTVRVERI